MMDIAKTVESTLIQAIDKAVKSTYTV